MESNEAAPTGLGLRGDGDAPGFPGFVAGALALPDGAVHVRIGGPAAGAPLLLLHGFPQTGAMWARVAARLAAEGRRVIAPDLPGYGASAFAAGASTPERMRKRRLAADMAALMRALGHERFDIAGHDRGGRVAYRLALDHPETVRRIAVLDIVPTYDYWAKFADRAFALAIYHWAFLAQPAPFPETLIGAAPDAFTDHTLAGWTAARDLSAFAPDALAAYRENARRPERLAAMCDDYRAGATLDVEDDAADRRAGRRIAAPLCALWGGAGIAQKAATPLDVWRAWAERVEGRPLDCGHFLPEEQPDATAQALSAFFAG